MAITIALAGNPIVVSQHFLTASLVPTNMFVTGQG